MKKIILLISGLLLFNFVFAQPKAKDYFLKRSKNQKTAAWIMLIGGTVTTAVGAAVSVSGGLDRAFGDPSADKNQTLADILSYTGSAAMLGSIPLFIAAGKNKKKGMSLSVGGQLAPEIIKTNLAYKTVPSIILKIGL